MKLTWNDIKNSRIPAAMDLCSDDARLMQWYNEFQQRALNAGRWWGTVRDATFCLTDQCFVMPREVALIERISMCSHRFEMSGIGYSFGAASGESICNGCSSGSFSCGHMRYEEKNTVASFSTTIGTNKKIRTYCNPADVGKKIIFRGYDKNKIWVRTSIDGSIADGEEVTLTMPFVDTVTEWWPGAPMAVIKDPTSYLVRGYEYNTATTAERALFVYQPSETVPSYRSGFIGSFPAGSCCSVDGVSTRGISEELKRFR